MSGAGPAVSSASGSLLSAGRPRLTLYLDVVSPFAYIAFWVTKNSPVFKQCDVTYIPILLGGVMKACGNTPPIEIKNKDKWINQERKRWASYFKMPISAEPPKPFPQPTINTGRALCAVSMLYPEKLPSAFEALYRAFWVEGKTINTPDVISEALKTELSGSEVEKVMSKIADPQVKKLLSSNTDKAMDEGAFGLPWYVAENGKGEREAFWGVDHLGQAVEFLGLDKGSEPGLRAML